MLIPDLPDREEDLLRQPTARIPDLPPIAEPEDMPPKRKKSTKVGIILGLIAGGLIVLLVLVMLIWGIILICGDTIFPNVYVAGINVGGMDRQSAIETVEEPLASSYASSTLKIQLPDRTLALTPDKTNVVLDGEEAIDAAMEYGRSGNPFSAVTTYLANRYQDNKEYSVDLHSALDLDTEYIRSALEEVAAQVQTSPSPSTASYDEEKEQLIIEVGYPERELNVDELFDVVYTAFSNSNFAPIQWAYDEEPTEHVDLTPYFERYCTAVQDAYYDEETRVIADAVAGYGFDMDTVMQKMSTASPGSRLVINMTDLEPTVTVEVLEKEMFGTELFAHSTEYVNNANRTKNLTLACQAINGMILNPGDVFSFNNAVGERTAAKGYLPATVYNGGQSVDELGGGVCQVASTLYYCTLHLNLEQVHREPHIYVVTYVPYGMDATVYWGQIDYQFRNTLSHPIRIMANTDDGHVNISFQGIKETDNVVKMSYNILATYPWQEIVELDETKEPGYRQVEVTPYTGYRVETYKAILDADGNEISKELEAISVYSKRDQKVIVGPDDTTIPDDPFDPDLWPGGDSDGDGESSEDPGLWPDGGNEGEGSEGEGGEDPGLWPDGGNEGDGGDSSGDTGSDSSGNENDLPVA